MAAKERDERYDIPPDGARILIYGRVHEVTGVEDPTGRGLGEKGGAHTRHEPGDGSGPTRHFWDAGTPWRPATGQPWDEDRTTPAERALRIDALAHHADRDALQAVLEAGAVALVASGHESAEVERLAAAIAGTFDPYPPEYATDRRVHLINGDEAQIVGRYLNGRGEWEYMVRHGDGGVYVEGNLFAAWLRHTEPKMRAPKPESEAVRRALDAVLSQKGEDGGPDKWEALGLTSLIEGRLAVGGTDARRKIAGRLRELDDPTGEVADFADRLEATPWEES
jgi:hypothetical protein